MEYDCRHGLHMSLAMGNPGDGLDVCDRCNADMGYSNLLYDPNNEANRTTRIYNENTAQCLRWLTTSVLRNLALKGFPCSKQANIPVKGFMPFHGFSARVYPRVFSQIAIKIRVVLLASWGGARRSN